MSAFDLVVRGPTQVQIPQGINQGAQNLMQFMRVQQDSKNKRDTLALETKKADAAEKHRAGQLDLDTQRTSNQQSNFLANQNLADRKFTFDQGADARELAGNVALNQAFAGASAKALGGLAENFNFTQGNVAAYKADPRYQAMGPEEQQAFDTNAIGQFRGNIGKHAGMQKVEQALRAKMANTGGTPEQVENRVQAILKGMFPEQQPMNAATLKAMMPGASGSFAKPQGLDNASKIIQEQNFVNDWKERASVEKGSGSFFDFFDQDLTDQNIANYTAQMKGQGFNAVQALTALDTIRDDDTIDVKFKDFMSAPKRLAAGEISADSKDYKAYQKVLGAASNARGLSPQGQNAQGGNSAAMMRLFAQQNQPRGQASTELQRREILLGMLGEKIKAAQQIGAGNQEVDEEVISLKNEIDSIDANATNIPQEEGGGALDYLFGKNASSLKSGINALGNAGSSALDVGSNVLSDSSERFAKTREDSGLLSALAKRFTGVEAISSLADNILPNNSGAEQIGNKEKIFKRELAQQKSGPQSAVSAARIEELEKLLLELKG